MTSRKKPANNQPSLFGDVSRKREVKPRKANPLIPLVQAIETVVGVAQVNAARGRVFGIAKAMHMRGITPAEVHGLPRVIRQYAAWRTVLDLATVQQCWHWLRNPPQMTQDKRSPLDRARDAIEAYDGKPPF